MDTLAYFLWGFLIVAFISAIVPSPYNYMTDDMIVGRSTYEREECYYDLYDCEHFATRSEAQAMFLKCGGISNDIHYLDGDNDGIACENLLTKRGLEEKELRNQRKRAAGITPAGEKQVVL